MSETKYELPPAMVEAAAFTIHSYGVDSECADDLAEAALKAAGVADLMARIAELEVSLVDAFDWIGHLPKSADSASAVSVNDWIRQAAALLKKAQASAGGE